MYIPHKSKIYSKNIPCFQPNSIHFTIYKKSKKKNLNLNRNQEYTKKKHLSNFKYLHFNTPFKSFIFVLFSIVEVRMCLQHKELSTIYIYAKISI